MKTKYPILFFIIILIVSCSSDEGNDYVALPIVANSDAAQVFQNQFVEIDVLSNDENIPTNGILTVSTPANGSVEVIDANNTPSNPSDDIILYTPNDTFLGEVTFNYTICDNLSNCATETVTVTVMDPSPVNINLNQVPYPTLSEYNFYEGNMANLQPVFGVLPYELITPLFTDYALKKRFVWMPNGQKATYTSDSEIFNFPTGTVLIKNFYYNNVLPNNTTRIIETRLLIKKANEWIFAEYIWNEAQTEATLDVSGNGGFLEIEWLQNGEPKSVNYRIPSQFECLTCHKQQVNAIPIGPKPQNINSIFNYEDGSQNQLSKWESMGYLNSNYPSSIQTTVNWEDTSQPLELRVRSYFDVNCAHCHMDLGHCDYRPIRLAFNESSDPTNLGVCVEPEDDITPFLNGENPTHIVFPGDIQKSVTYFRLNTQEENVKMPLIGRSLIHEEGVDLLINWINSLQSSCE
ncbi:MAG: hypothetical protein H0X63_00375 [Flavobacteriales bacterium]|nr:hypothetical protein [Flavobacteriales bacterium]